VTYAVLLAPLLVAAAIVTAVALRRDRRGWLALAIAAAILLVLTAVFDTAMIAADLFRYDEALLLGARVGLAPVEDLAYALIALGVVVALWRLLPSRSPSSARSDRRASQGPSTGDAPAEPADA